MAKNQPMQTMAKHSLIYSISSVITKEKRHITHTKYGNRQ